jgi:hypothetical protein
MEALNISEFLHALTNPSRQDLITAIFDLIFVCSGISNVKRLIKDKQVKGFDWRNMCLYLAWNIWSTFVIYPAAQMHLANVVNFVYMLTQVTWLVLLVRYNRRILK